MNPKAPLWLSAAVLCLPGMLSSCADRRIGLVGQAIGQSPPINICPPRRAEHLSDVDIRLDTLDTERLTALAEAGRSDAMVLLALRYAPSAQTADTNANPMPDMDKALVLLQRAIDKRNADAEYLMGAAHMSGTGVPKNEVKAAYWFKRSAQHGNPTAHYWFGEMTAKGRGGTTQDWKAAIPYFTRAAERGITDAYLELGYMYSNGYGELEQDPHKAAFCYRQVQIKSPLAQFNLRRLIDDGKIEWEAGDPGAPLEKPPSSPKN